MQRSYLNRHHLAFGLRGLCHADALVGAAGECGSAGSVGSGAVSLWTPAEFLDGVNALWCDLDNDSMDAGATIERVYCSGNLGNIGQSNAARRPLLTTIEGKVGASFDGADDSWISNQAVGVWLMHQSDGFTYCEVVKPAADAAGDDTLIDTCHSTAAANGITVRYDAANEQLRLFVAVGEVAFAIDLVTGVGTMLKGATHRVAVTWTHAAGARIRINDAAVVTQATAEGPSANPASATLQVNRESTGANVGKHLRAGPLVRHGAVSDADITKWLAWAASYFALGTILALGAPPSVPDSLTLYQADLHAHSSVSDAGGNTTPQYFTAADSAGLDVAAITDHSEQIGAGEWTQQATDAATATTGSFLALRAEEMTHTWHSNVFFSDDIYAADWPNFYTTLAADTGALAGFNHITQAGDLPTTYNAGAASQMVYAELVTENYADSNWDVAWAHYLTFLDAGWQVASACNSDTHTNDPGFDGMRTNLFATGLTGAEIKTAMAARKFNGSTCGDGAWAYLKCGDASMGGTANSTATMPVTIDIAAAAAISRVELYTDAGLVHSTPSPSTNNARFTGTIPGTSAYVVAVIVRTDGEHLATAPVWIT